MPCSQLAGRRYSQSEVRGLLAQAGWPAHLIETMSAIVMAESSGYSAAHNTCGENSCGLCQVYVDVHRQYTCQQMYDPIANLRACYRIYLDRQRTGRNGFTPWGAFTDGRYRQYLNTGGGTVQPTVQQTQVIADPQQVYAIANNNPPPSSVGFGQQLFIVVGIGLAALLIVGQFGEEY